MPQDNVIKLIQPGFFDDQLTEILRNGARALRACYLDDLHGFHHGTPELRVKLGRWG